MTIFGWIYLFFTVVYIGGQILSIDKPRNPLTREAVVGSIIGTALSFWALYSWGIRG